MTDDGIGNFEAKLKRIKEKYWLDLDAITISTSKSRRQVLESIPHAPKWIAQVDLIDELSIGKSAMLKHLRGLGRKLVLRRKFGIRVYWQRTGKEEEGS